MTLLIVYDVLPSFVLGFHGCDAALAEHVFAGREHLRPSENEYDWLGHGVYFWEQNPQRALEYAKHLKNNPGRSRRASVKRPAMIGAVIDLGCCLNLLDARFLDLVRNGYRELKKYHASKGLPMPRNKPVGRTRELLLLRDLDCAVIETVHEVRKQSHRPAFDTVRAVFVEGEPLYDGAGFHNKNHIQICVRNPRCIKGYFRVLSLPGKRRT